MKKSSGMTLIEMIIAIVLMGIAMVAFTSFLVPQIRDSAIPHYQTRAVALGQGFMSQILARGFDENSNVDGGLVRCGEGDAGTKQERCTEPDDLGEDSGENRPSDFNDVDDYIGCWSTPTTVSQCTGYSRGNLRNVLDSQDEDSSDSYKNFRVEVDVAYYNVTTGSSAPTKSTSITPYKKVTLTIYSSNTQPLSITAFRGNY
ncbi:type II secretion system protein [Vibrio sp. T13N]|uniref:type IV pilus modification PilV family protein n=1 Tax=Vibrio sp. T13N TaxID=3080011 RepID=UPI0029415E60|nr:type II secretion system protein [Vibrio sp. T13N]MDV5054076.1 type II secretion system protein [Vibrio sp. T13N]